MPALKNARHEAFAQALFAGKSQRAAYREVYPKAENWKDSTADNTAYKLAKTDEITTRLQELKDAAASPLILDRQGRMLILTEMANNEKLTPKARLQAIDILNKMCGDYTQRIEAVVSSDISATAAQVARILDG